MGLFILTKKYFIGLPIVAGWTFVFLIAIFGFIWQTIDMGKIDVFAFVASLALPLILEIILIIIFCQYITVDCCGVKKYFLKRKLVEFNWENIKEIRIDVGMVYISLEELQGQKKHWNKKNIFI